MFMDFVFWIISCNGNLILIKVTYFYLVNKSP